jgi:hypothetical protein
MGPPAPYRGSASPGRPSQPGNAPSQQPDSTVLWRRDDTPPSSRQPAEPAGGIGDPTVLWVRSEPAQTQRAGLGVQRDSGAPDSTVLWRRDESAAPRSLTFPGHSTGSEYLRAAGSAGESLHQNGLSEPLSSEADPWTAPQQPQSAVSAEAASAEEWIRIHADLQPRGEDPWRDPLGNAAQTGQPSSVRSGVAEAEPAVGPVHAHGGEGGRGYAAARGVSQTGGQENGRPRDKGRLRNKSVLYNNVEEVPSVRRQSAYIRK